MDRVKNIVFFVLVVTILTGCSLKNNWLFYKNSSSFEVDNSADESTLTQEYKIKPHDRLSIIFFEYPELSTKSKDRSESDVGIEVGLDGKIMMPLIGKIEVAGKTKEAVVDMLYEIYSEYLEKPALRVEVLNQSVYVFGEVKNPGVVKLINQREVTPIEAIIQRGGLTNFARRDVVKVVRGDRSNYRIFTINLTDMSSIEKSNIKLLPDDIIYVAHNRVKDFNIPLSGADPSLSWINTLFSTLTLYRALK